MREDPSQDSEKLMLERTCFETTSESERHVPETFRYSAGRQVEATASSRLAFLGILSS